MRGHRRHGSISQWLRLRHHSAQAVCVLISLWFLIRFALCQTFYYCTYNMILPASAWHMFQYHNYSNKRYNSAEEIGVPSVLTLTKFEYYIAHKSCLPITNGCAHFAFQSNTQVCCIREPRLKALVVCFYFCKWYYVLCMLIVCLPLCLFAMISVDNLLHIHHFTLYLE